MPAKKITNKSDFIRQHASLSTADVIAKAKTAGLKVSSSLVYMVRSRAGAKKAVAKKTSAKPTAAPSKAAPASVSKADFVRARTHLSPKEIVEDARTAGVKFDAGYVQFRGRSPTGRPPRICFVRLPLRLALVAPSSFFRANARGCIRS
jgi:hypothetical protein